MNKVLIVIPSDYLGGAEQVLKMIALNWPDSIVNVHFLCYKNLENWNNLPSNVKLSFSSRTSVYKGWLIFLFSRILKYAGPYRYIFTSHVFVTGLIGILLRMGRLKSTYFVGRESTEIFTRFSGIKLFLYKQLYRWGYPALDLLVCQTEKMKSELLLNLPSLGSTISLVVIPNPINLCNIDAVLEDPAGRFVVAAGRLIPEKGFDILIEAFVEIKKKHPDLSLIILGEGPERAKLERIIVNTGMQNDVFLQGHVSNVYPYFKRAKVCVVSSRVEGFPNVLLQMMSQNCRVVSTRCAGGIEDIEGIFVAVKTDVVSLENSLTRALESDVTGNRAIFDLFLKERSVFNFVSQIKKNLDND